MAVRAPDFTLRDFFLDPGPLVSPNHGRYGFYFPTTDVVKLKAHRIGFPAIDATMHGEISPKPLLILFFDFVIAFPRFAEVVRRVILVMDLQLTPSAVPAVTLPQALGFHPVIEFFDRLLLTATATDFRFHVSIQSGFVQSAMLTPAELRAQSPRSTISLSPG
jgi:hypothetical protein